MTVTSPRVRSRRFPAVTITSLAVVAMAWAFFKGRGDVSPPAHSGRGHERGRFVDSETSCGPVSLAVVTHLLGRPVPISVFHEETGAGALGVCSIADLRRALESHGFAATAVRYDPREPPTHRLPMILFVDQYHFAAALPAPNGKVVVVDPPVEPAAIAWRTLARRWQGEALVVGRSGADVEHALARK